MATFLTKTTDGCLTTTPVYLYFVLTNTETILNDLDPSTYFQGIAVYNNNRVRRVDASLTGQVASSNTAMHCEGFEGTVHVSLYLDQALHAEV